MTTELDAQIASSAAPITAIVTAFQRIDATIDTLKRLEACQPPPAEILVHVDGNETTCAATVRAAFPQLCILVSEASVGPGGGRNKLIAASTHELVASFDDDSYPIDPDYFARILSVTSAFPDAAVYSASIFHRGEPEPPIDEPLSLVSSFGSGGAVFRKSAYIDAGGFVPLPIAYGMEEEDLALRLLDRGRAMLKCPSLRVFHDTDLSHHPSPRINGGVIANIALLVALRYPIAFWPYGLAQVVNRIVWGLKNGRRVGIVSGLVSIPGHIWSHRHLRAPVSIATIQQRRTLRREPTKLRIEPGTKARAEL